MFVCRISREAEAGRKKGFEDERCFGGPEDGRRRGAEAKEREREKERERGGDEKSARPESG